MNNTTKTTMNNTTNVIAINAKTYQNAFLKALDSAKKFAGKKIEHNNIQISINSDKIVIFSHNLFCAYVQEIELYEKLDIEQEYFFTLSILQLKQFQDLKNKSSELNLKIDIDKNSLFFNNKEINDCKATISKQTITYKSLNKNNKDSFRTSLVVNENFCDIIHKFLGQYNENDKVIFNVNANEQALNFNAIPTIANEILEFDLALTYKLKDIKDYENINFNINPFYLNKAISSFLTNKTSKIKFYLNKAISSFLTNKTSKINIDIHKNFIALSRGNLTIYIALIARY